MCASKTKTRANLHVLLILGFCLPLSGCQSEPLAHSASAEAEQDFYDAINSDDGSVQQGSNADKGSAFDQRPSSHNAELNTSIPILPPKPLKWRDEIRLQDLAGDPWVSSAARDAVREADQLKAIGSYAQAEKRYQRALAEDPQFAFAAYQLACNYELWGKPALAEESFQRAIKLGFKDFPVALGDDELGHIRNLPNFQEDLAQMRTRYLVDLNSRLGQPIAMKPVGAPPPQGWPLVVLLHGYGDTNVSYLDNAAEWTDLGYVAVALPGSVPMQSGRFQWATHSTEPTHVAVQEVVNSKLLADSINEDQVYLLGFSQGALHATLVAAEYPDLYAGVVAISPGGSQGAKLLNPQFGPGNVNLYFTYGIREGLGQLVTPIQTACRQAGWNFQFRVHSGSHHFPGSWDQDRRQVARFLRSGR